MWQAHEKARLLPYRAAFPVDHDKTSVAAFPLDHKDPAVRVAALRALAQRPAEDLAAHAMISGVAELLNDADEDVRRAAAETLTIHQHKLVAKQSFAEALGLPMPEELFRRVRRVAKLLEGARDVVVETLTNHQKKLVATLQAGNSNQLEALTALAATLQLMSYDARPENGTLYVKLTRASGLASMDSNGFSDPYAELTLGKVTHPSKTIRRQLDPVWNETFQFKGQLDDLLNKMLVVRLWDWDWNWWSRKHNRDDDDPLGTCTFNLGVRREVLSLKKVRKGETMLIQQEAYQFSEAVILHDRTRGDRVRGVVYLEAWFEPNGGEGGGNGGAAVHAKAIVGKLEDGVSEVRQAALYALAQLPIEDFVTQVPHIVGKLKDTDPKVRLAAVKALAKLRMLSGKLLQTHLEHQVQDILEMINAHDDPEVRRAAVVALAHLPPSAFFATDLRLVHEHNTIQHEHNTIQRMNMANVWFAFKSLVCIKQGTIIKHGMHGTQIGQMNLALFNIFDVAGNPAGIKALLQEELDELERARRNPQDELLDILYQTLVRSRRS